MKLTIEQPALKDALAKATKAVQKRTIIPALAMVRLTADGDELSITGSDLDREVTTRATATVDATGGACVNADALLAHVGKLPAGALVSVDLDQATLTVKVGRSVRKLPTLPAEDFPVMATDTYEAELTLQSHEVQDLFGKVSFAASTEETRYYLCGVYLTQEDGRMVSVATDGHRLAKWVSGVSGDFPAVIVPSDTIKAAVWPESGDVVVSISATKIKFAAGNWSMVSKVIDGIYPDYRRVIPSGNTGRAMFDGGAMKSSLAMVSTAASDRSRGVKFAIGDGAIELTAKSSELGEAVDTVAAEVAGDDLEIGFNSNYVVGAMSLLDGAAVLEYGGTGDPVVIKDDAAPDWLCVLMPLRV